MPQEGIKVCELVLFMLMPERRCEGHHVDTQPLITILRSPHSRKTEQHQLVQPLHGRRHNLQRRFH
jgi:hypothetical protein